MNDSFQVHWLNNPFDYSDVTHYPVAPNQTIQQWLDNNGGLERLNQMPTVCVYKNRELMRSEYDQIIEDHVCFIMMPTGGDSGSNPLAMVAMLALTVYTGGLTSGWLKAGHSAYAIAGAQTAIMAGGAILINAVFPPPGLPNSAGSTQGSPTYSVSAQGNSARLRGPIPVNYGRMRIYPDFAANPYSEYESNEQYHYQLFCIGQGQNRLTNVRLDNTSIENFAEATLEIIPPMGTVTLFHTAVVLAPEAGGQDMTDPITLGPYTVNDSGTQISLTAHSVH